MSQPALELAPSKPAVRRFPLFADLDQTAPSFPRVAAERVVRLVTVEAIETALANVPGDFRVFVETLVITGIAYRIARLPDVEDRRAALAKVPPSLRPRIEPHVARYYQIKPWRVQERAN